MTGFGIQLFVSFVYFAFLRPGDYPKSSGSTSLYWRPDCFDNFVQKCLATPHPNYCHFCPLHSPYCLTCGLKGWWYLLTGDAPVSSLSLVTGLATQVAFNSRTVPELSLTEPVSTNLGKFKGGKL